MRALGYAFTYVVPAWVLVSLISEGWQTFWALIIFFGLIPICELLLNGDTTNLSPDEERTALGQRIYDWLVWSMVPVQWGLMAFFLWRLSTAPHLTPVEFVGMSLSMGMACGILGINVGHELGHRRKKSEQIMAKALLSSSLYAHFFIEHNRGHHARVATPDDPATSRLNEPLYVFWFRSMFQSVASAWHLENERLRARGARVLSWQNEMIRLTFFQVAFVAAAGLLFGPVAMGGLLLAALTGALLLETVNYIEHYGLLRRQLPDGRYERVQPHHSWNSNHPLGRIVLFDLTRHADHHANARRKYQVLRHFDDAPQLPMGYPGMILLALVPPLFFAIMNPRVTGLRRDAERNAPSAEPLAA